MRIYLDNAASTPLDPEVFEHMRPYLLDHCGNPSSTHAHGRELRGAIEKARRSIAECIGALPAEIFFTSGGTEADNTAIRGAVEGYGISHVISTQIEHHAVTHTIEELEKAGKVSVSWLKTDGLGHIDLQALRSALQQHPRSLVCLMHGNNEIGTLHDIAAIGELCAEYDALFHSDTVQTMGHMSLDFRQLNVHFAAASAHKFYGPKGCGFLFMKQGVKIPSLILGGGQERNLRAGTENAPAIVGMAFALAKCYAHLPEKNAHLQDLKNYLKTQLESQLPGVQFNGDTRIDRAIPTVLNVAPPCGEEDAMLIFNLDLAGISASGGSACSSGALQGSHVLRTLGLPPSRVTNSVRFSFGPQNTREEIDVVVAKLKRIVTEEAWS